jgi:hypothetical protein
MSFPNPNEPIPDEDIYCTNCGLELRPDQGRVRYMRRLSVGRIRQGVFHASCAPEDINAWLAVVEEIDGVPKDMTNEYRATQRHTEEP